MYDFFIISYLENISLSNFVVFLNVDIYYYIILKKRNY